MLRGSRELCAGRARWRRLTAGITMAAVVMLASWATAMTVGGVEAAGEPRVLTPLLKEAAGQPDRSYRLLVQRGVAGQAADQAAARLGGKKLTEVKTGPHGGFVVQLNGRAVEALGRNPAVRWVTVDAPMVASGTVDTSRLVNVYDGAVSATALWSTASTSNVTGKGVGVAILDTGINSSLDFSGPDGKSRIVASVLFNSSVRGWKDGHGHGTHVAGIVGGDSNFATNSAGYGKYVGIAPRANLIDVRVSDDQGMSYVSDVVNAIDWVIANRQLYNIRVMNLSLISSVAESYRTSPLAAAVEKAWFSGVFVVVSSGNLGPNTANYPPANDPFVVAVGAGDPMGTASKVDDGVAPWSSYGTTQDGYARPDVVAPGRYIVSTLAGPQATLAKNYPDRVVDNSYIRLSGTSMAAPVVAGLAALAFEAHPEWTNDQLKWVLQNTATPLANVPAAAQGAGEVDAQKVVQYTGTVESANQGQPISLQLVGPNGETVYTESTTSTSSSTSTWSTSSWSTSSWSTSSWSTSSWSTSSWSTSSWSTNGSFQSGAVD
ncbi:MAG TPA: S8 family peptidase [Chloroflexota bacterium]|nr:S8 family peptidase [Chloroflexota bacterium]